ncbi:MULTISPECIES: hypothetical protein [Bacillus]|uniref:hypothetical protein n=1 Tax=Bacillus TaxID=1386 RepID=UPI000BF053FB|nr:hypothetical protein [Bacillus wiedmannii]PEM24427.1 hypothetical protein CN617_24685 [Bacillus wiedmannii]PFM45765.1 hypothetical protein COJ45_18795 [Bacillus cereus]PGS20372.1 hypothetical protein COC59_25010 [Bacillus cereus]
MSNNTVAVLFTGGRDSSLVACMEALKGNTVHLLTCDSGIGIKKDVSNYRVEELMARFPTQIIKRVILPTYGIFRSIAIENIENDFTRWNRNLILLGDKMAIHAAATVYCMQNDIPRLVDGCVSYQRDLAEQKAIAIDLFRKFEGNYGIDYDCPIYYCSSQDEVKYKLLTLGISSKSLEGVSIFGDSFTEPTDDEVKEYIEDKINICIEYVDMLMAKNTSKNMNYSSRLKIFDNITS